MKKIEREQFGSRIDAGGDMYETHQKFLAWAASYDDGGLEMRSRASPDAWEKLLTCPRISLDGSLPAAENFERIRRYLP